MDLRDILDFVIPDELLGIVSAVRLIYKGLVKLSGVLGRNVGWGIALATGSVGAALLYRRIGKKMHAQATGTARMRGVVLGRDGRPKGEVEA